MHRAIPISPFAYLCLVCIPSSIAKLNKRAFSWACLAATMSSLSCSIAPRSVHEVAGEETLMNLDNTIVPSFQWFLF
jgi:hypothetical protein